MYRRDPDIIEIPYGPLQSYSSGYMRVYLHVNHVIEEFMDHHAGRARQKQCAPGQMPAGLPARSGQWAAPPTSVSTSSRAQLSLTCPAMRSTPPLSSPQLAHRPYICPGW